MLYIELYMYMPACYTCLVKKYHCSFWDVGIWIRYRRHTPYLHCSVSRRVAAANINHHRLKFCAHNIKSICNAAFYWGQWFPKWTQNPLLLFRFAFREVKKLMCYGGWTWRSIIRLCNLQWRNESDIITIIIIIILDDKFTILIAK